MIGIEGQININVLRNVNARTRVDITSSRPVLAAKVLIGKTSNQALDIIPLLFSVCGIAQSRAAFSALQTYQSTPVNDNCEQARDLLVLAENAKEHLLRVFLDWPKLFQYNISTQKLPYISQLTKQFKMALFKQGDAFSLQNQCTSDYAVTRALIDELENYLSEEVFAMPLEQWLAIKDIDELHHWAMNTECLSALTLQLICEQGWTTQGLTHCMPLPTLDHNDLITQLEKKNCESFIATPSWQGNCHETTSFSRQFQQPLIKNLYKEFNTGLITRWTARLIELALIPSQMCALLKPDNKNKAKHSAQSILGVSQVEAARGRLIHRVEMENDIIRNYQILAPTEWNFHPKGIIAEGLANIQAKNDDEYKQLAHLMINAVDPCVAYQLRVQ